jgi:hypothetical protein
MAERQVSAGEGGSLIGAAVSLVATAFVAVASFAQKVLDGIMADGTIKAAGRMGIDELGEALKPFPESISIQESGTIWNPTQGEIQADRKPERHSDGPPHPWPSEIAAANRHQSAGHDHGHGHGHDNGHDAGLSL